MTTVKTTKLQGMLQFEDVIFWYNNDFKRVVLSNVSFVISHGKTLGIVGPIGSGKSAICQLIPRLRDVREGRIRIDGIDIRGISLEILRSHIASVPQESFFFSGTIRENLCFGKTDASQQEIVDVAKAAQLYETILQFPNGFDTIIGEKGIMLSGGQRQRLAIARAMLIPVPILILDDPLSEVDSDTASLILDSLKEGAQLRTTIIVSHRLHHVSFADTIIVMEEGRVIEKGSHEQLIRLGGVYKKTYDLQSMMDS